MKNKKLEKEIVALVLTIVFCVIAVSIVLLILISTFDEKQNEVKIEKEKPPVVSTHSASLFLGGKISFDEKFIADYKNADGIDFYPMFENIEPSVINNDISIFQLDDVVVTDYKGEGVPTPFVDQLVSFGFNMVSLASANALDQGENQLLLSHQYWDHEAIYTAGSHDKENKALEIYEKNGITFGLLAYTMPSNLDETILSDYVLTTYEDKKAITEISELKRQVDVILVYMDWDNIKSSDVTEEQVRIAKLLADSGADIVLGTNTETIQPIQWIDDTLIYYSLGNLITENTELNQRIGLVGSIYIQKTVVDGVVTIEKSQPKADLVYMELKDKAKISMLDEPTTQLANKDEVYAKYSSIITQLDNSIRVGGIK